MHDQDLTPEEKRLYVLLLKENLQAGRGNPVIIRAKVKELEDTNPKSAIAH